MLALEAHILRIVKEGKKLVAERETLKEDIEDQPRSPSKTYE